MSEVRAGHTASRARGASPERTVNEEGRIHSAVADENDFPELAARISGADAAALLPVYADERVPLLTAVIPDSDGVVRARW